MRVLLTGATSFTGAHICQTIRSSGIEVWATLTGPKESYKKDALAVRRMEFASPHQWLESCPFGSKAFLKALKDQNFSVLINHGAAIHGYRNELFDYRASVLSALNQLEETLSLAQRSGCKLLLHSGTVFESTTQLPAISPYGVAKSMIWEAIRYFSQREKIPVAKVAIPNPVGPLESSDRLTSVFMQKWSRGETFNLSTPTHVVDFLPAPWLARVYLRCIQRLSSGQAYEEFEIQRPSGWILSNQDWLNLLVFQAKERVSFARPHFTISKNLASSVNLRSRVNDQPVPELQQTKEIELFWNDLFDYYRQRLS
jgi:nucleoside-diphosphate-sugar epimerase